MKRLTVFSKILILILLILIIIFGIWYFFIKEDNYKRFFLKEIALNNYYSIPLSFQIKNGNKYHTNLYLKCNIKNDFYKHYCDIQQYIVYNIQNDFYDYTCLLNDQDVYNKRLNHKLYIQDIIESKLDNNLIDIQQISLSEISTE